MYPLPLPNQWLNAKTHLLNASFKPAQQWIESESSLTIRIKELGIAFSLQVLNQTEQQLSLEQQQLLHTTDTSALFREVLLKQGEIPLVYAQTIMPASTVTGTETMLAELGNQPLGQVLFQSPQAVRSNIEFAEVTPNSQLGKFIQNQLQQAIVHPCYVRRSHFQLNTKPLLVCECFLPALFE